MAHFTGFLDKSHHIDFFRFFSFFCTFSHKSHWSKNLSFPDLRLWHVNRVMFDSIRRHFAYHIIRIIGPAENGAQKIVPNDLFGILIKYDQICWAIKYRAYTKFVLQWRSMKCPASAEAELKSSFMYMLKEQFNYNRPSFLAWQDGVEFFYRWRYHDDSQITWTSIRL